MTDASEAFEQKKYFKCLTSIRKAIFIEIEQDYCIYEWRNSDPNQPLGLLGMPTRGIKAPFYTQNKAWIEQNVNDPFDYIQIDHNQIRQDLLEWGASTQDYWNIWRLTPEVMRLSKEGDWLLKGELKHLYQAATKENAVFCLDRAITLLAKKQFHHDLARWLEYSAQNDLKVRLKEQSTLYKKASSLSEVLAYLPENNSYKALSIVPGMNGNGRYVSIIHLQSDEQRILSGYVDLDLCELLKPEEEGDSK